MSQTKLSNYAQATYNPDDANPLHIGARASSRDGHEFGDAGEVYLSDEEAKRLQTFLNDVYGEEQ